MSHIIFYSCKGGRGAGGGAEAATAMVIEKASKPFFVFMINSSFIITFAKVSSCPRFMKRNLQKTK